MTNAGSALARYIATVAVIALSACSQPVERPNAASPSAGPACNLAGFLAVQHAHANRAEVTLCGTVERVGPPRHTRSGLHRAFCIDVGHDDCVRIDANLDVMGVFPIRNGEAAVVRGEYYYDSDGRDGVHWTHRTDRGTHPPGYLILNGTTYS